MRAKAAGLAAVSDVALLKRLRCAEALLRLLCVRLLKKTPEGFPTSHGARLCAFLEATVVKEPGPTGSLWRLHYSLQIPSLLRDFFELTPTQGEGSGESFRRFPVSPHDFVLGDAGYCTPGRVEYLPRQGAYVLVRANAQSLPLHSPGGTPWAILPHLHSLAEVGRIAAWEVAIRGPQRRMPRRLCALRKSEHSIRQAHRKLRRKAGKKGVAVQPETFEYAKYVLVFTTFPEEDSSAPQILEWYRVRWQVELVFKRLKSLAQLGHLPKHDECSARVWLYGKMLVALLTQKLVRIGRDISPWGYLLLPEASQ